MKNRRVGAVLLGCLMGAVFAGASAAWIWYYYGQRYYSGGPLGAQAGWLNGIFYALHGLCFGGLGGAITGGTIAYLRSRKVLGVILRCLSGMILGSLSNVVLPLSSLISNRDYMGTSEIRIYEFSIIWQAVTGGLVGLGIAMFFEYYWNRKEKAELNSLG